MVFTPKTKWAGQGIYPHPLTWWDSDSKLDLHYSGQLVRYLFSSFRLPALLSAWVLRILSYLCIFWGSANDFQAPLSVALSFRGFPPLISSCSHSPEIYITYLKPVRLQHLMWVLVIPELYALEGKIHVKYWSHPMWFWFFKGSVFSDFCFFWSFSSAFF